MQAGGLVADRAMLDRTSTVERVAGILRTRINDGYLSPGVRLAEKEIAEALRISRNTLREAFRLLTHEGLLTHRLNRGVFVRMLDIDDVQDLYRLRKYIECSVVRAVRARPADLSRIAGVIQEGEHARSREDWRGLGTADIRFHHALVALAGSDRINEWMRAVLAELRLVFHVMANPRWFHEPYLGRNREILTALERGDGAEAGRLLLEYLDDAETQLLEAYTHRDAGQPG